MRIITAAIPQTGDLWLYNATRLICEQNGSVYAVESNHYYEYEAKQYDFQIVKTVKYELDLTNNSVVVCTSRDPSGLFFDQNAKPSLIGLYYDQSLWNGYANCVIEYEQIKTNQLKAITRLAYSISLQCDPVMIANELNEIKAPAQGIDNKTLLSKTTVLI